jgi:perosamine synthetase
MASDLTRIHRPVTPLPRMLGQLWGSTTLGDDFAALKSMLQKEDLVQGATIREYEQAFARAVGTRYAYSFSSGRVAFYAALCALGIGEGDDVLLQVPSHIVVPNAVRYTGACPVYVDCSLDTFNMNLEQAEKRITPRTRAILLQHTFGIPNNMDAAVDLAKRHNLILLEDCVHALGATYQGRPVGSFGKAGFFSTEETKIISSTMGGMAVTDDPELAKKIEAIQQTYPWPSAEVTSRYLLKFVMYHLFTHPYLHRYTRPLYMYLRQYPSTHLAPGATAGDEMRGGSKPAHYEMRLSNGQAALALRQLGRLKENLAHRRSIARAYKERLSALGFKTVEPPEGAEPSYVRYPVLVKHRPTAMRAAAPYAVLGQWFNTVLEESEKPESGGYVMGTCPRAEDAAVHLVNLPTHQRVTLQDVDKIVASLKGMAWTPE